jgi:UDP-N-acetylmuramoyl-tripeptide--D-alanyl-D-alanine ligase
MKKFLIADLARIIKAHPINRASRIEYRESNFTGVSTDSRTIQAGDCFFAITGDNFDGHNYVPDAFAKGALCAVVSKKIKDSSFPDRTILMVDDTVKALGDFARGYRRQCAFKVVAITGSVGKTTVRQIAYHVLSQHYRLHQAPKNFNNNIGLPLTLLGADPEDKIVVVELGSNHPGEIACLTQIALPDIAVVTNVYPVHLAGFGNLQTVAKEKLSISEGLPSDGILIINAGIACPELVEGVLRPARPLAQIITFGKSDGSNFQARNITSNGISSRFIIDGAEIYLPLAGPGNIENALAAWAVCSQFGITIDVFAQAVKTLSAVPMRAELLQIGTLTVLNDCYNANPASMKNALDILANLVSKEKHRAVFICGDMAELGQYTHALHTELGAAVAQAEVRLLLTVGKSAKIVAESAKNTAKYDLQTKSFTDTLAACNNLKKFIKDYDIVLVKGSRVNKLEMTVKKLKELFS